jgi:hypothetical protein
LQLIATAFICRLRLPCLPRLPNEIFVAFISSGFNFEEQRSGFNRGG